MKATFLKLIQKTSHCSKTASLSSLVIFFFVDDYLIDTIYDIFRFEINYNRHTVYEIVVNVMHTYLSLLDTSHKAKFIKSVIEKDSVTHEQTKRRL